MNVPFAIAGALSLVAALIHGGMGEALVVRRLQRDSLEPTRFGGRTMTLLMIRVTWHIVSLVFLVLGVGMTVCSSGGGEACEGVGRVVSISFASFAALAMGLALAGGTGFGALRKHPGPLVFVVVAALSWWGTTL